jgi:4-carboxymuconolactone decarboxylase
MTSAPETIQREQSPRLAPLEPPYTPQVAEMLAKWMPRGSAIEPLRLFRTLQLHEGLAQRMRPLGAGILGSSALLAPELREVMIHRTCALAGAEYEWGVHAVAYGRPLGFSDEQLRATVEGNHEDGCWSHEQALVLRLADELHATSAVSDELWDSLAQSFSSAELLELIAIAGWYHLIAYICNAARVAPEPWAERFPPRAPTARR